MSRDCYQVVTRWLRGRYNDGQVFRGFLLDEIVRAADALSREALAELTVTRAAKLINQLPAPPGVRALNKVLFEALSPPLTPTDQKVWAPPGTRLSHDCHTIVTCRFHYGPEDVGAATVTTPFHRRSISPFQHRSSTVPIAVTAHGSITVVLPSHCRRITVI